MRREVKRLFYRGGGLRFLQFINRRSVRILMYHSVGPLEPDFFPQGMSVSGQVFASQMRYCREHYTPISLSEFVACRLQGRPLPDRAVIVTIDDGFKNYFTTAFPILQEYRIPATVFLLTDWVFEQRMCWLHRFYYLMTRVPVEQVAEALAVEAEATLPQVQRQSHRGVIVEQAKDILKYKVANRHELLDRVYARLSVDTPLYVADSLYLSADDVRAMSKYNIEIGSHACTHTPMSALSSEQVRWELTKSKRMLEDCIGKPVQSFAYPFGLTCDLVDIRLILRESGYQCAVTARRGLVDGNADLYLLNRYKVSGQVGLWEEALAIELSPWLKR